MRTLTALLILSSLVACKGNGGDEDGDGHGADVDCNDTDPDVFPGATEACNGIDDNCDGAVDEGVTSTFFADTDGDGYGDLASTQSACDAPSGFVTDSTDCDDGSAAIYPGGTEACNGVDDNCDGAIDEGVTSTFFADADADGFGDASSTQQACEAPAGFVADDTDCDDTAAEVNPNATEVCNGVDDNCSNTVDEEVMTTYFADADGDTYGDAGATQEACSTPAGYAVDDTDCDDTSADIHPNATELCDGLDNDCNAVVDDGVGNTYYLDFDGDGFGDAQSPTGACSAPSGYVADATDCDDQSGVVFPGATESCNSIDDNCDGTVDEGVTLTFHVDLDGDTYGDPNATTQACAAGPGVVADSSDCDDQAGTINPGATETCNTLDDDCDGLVDDDDSSVTNTNTFYTDADLDNYGVLNGPTTNACVAPNGFVANTDDCDDADPAINPGATEIWYDGVDQDCANDNDWDADADGHDALIATNGDDCNDQDGGEYLCGSSMTTAMDSCLQIKGIRPTGAPTGTYYIDPAGTGAFPVVCDMVTNNGGWTLCGKFDRDNGTTPWLADPFARADVNTADLADVTTFTGAQASQDCRVLIQNGAKYVMSAGTDSGSAPWDMVRINNMFFRVKTDPTNLWDITLDEDATTTQATKAVTTFGPTLNNLGIMDGTNSLGDRCAQVGNGAMWTNIGRTGAAWSNAGTVDPNTGLCDDTASDTVYWAWEATDFSVDDHTCGSPVLGTGCGGTKATYRYNLMFMR